jgi:hypothetical protein
MASHPNLFFPIARLRWMWHSKQDPEATPLSFIPIDRSVKMEAVGSIK